MRIGFDARLINQSGVGRYIRNLLAGLLKFDHGNRYFIFTRTKDLQRINKLPGKNFEKIAVDLKWHSLKEQVLMPRILSSYGLDLVHFPYFNVPVFYRGKFIVTIHDLIVDHVETGRASTLPYPLYKIKRLFYRRTVKSAVKKASAIIAISQNTKNEIVSHYHVDPQKITVTYDGLDSNIKRPEKFSSLYPFDYLLNVGNAYPHKNLETLIEVFRDKAISSRLKLVLVGDDRFFYPRLKRLVAQKSLEYSVIFFGIADDRQLVNLYHNARALITPSYMEGFGLPNLEAVSLGCLPVISDIPVFREIWGDDLIMFDPREVNDLKRAILEFLALSESDKLHMLKKADKRATKFSWQKTVKQTLLLYNRV